MSNLHETINSFDTVGSDSSGSGLSGGKDFGLGGNHDFGSGGHDNSGGGLGGGHDFGDHTGGGGMGSGADFGDHGGGFVKPIAIDLNGDGINFIGMSKSNVQFNILGSMRTIDWITNDDAMLCFDMDGDKMITNIREVSFKMWNDNAKSDLDGLKFHFDTNKDGVFNDQDKEYANFYIWQDKNYNGKSEYDEMTSLKKLGLKEIDLSSTSQSWLNTNKASHILQSTSGLYEDGLKHNIYDIALEY